MLKYGMFEEDKEEEEEKKVKKSGAKEKEVKKRKKHGENIMIAQNTMAVLLPHSPPTYFSFSLAYYTMSSPSPTLASCHRYCLCRRSWLGRSRRKRLRTPPKTPLN